MLASRTQLITHLLQDMHLGHADARDRLWDAVYQELHQLAESHMAREANGRTLQPTALVHEAYLRLIDGGDGAFENRRHFFAAAATAMRRILVDDARRRGRVKRGGLPLANRGEPHAREGGGNGHPPAPTDEAGATAASDTDGDGPPSCAAALPRRRVELEDCAAADGPDPGDVLAVNEVMAALEREHPLLARVVELRFFAGLSVDQTAEALEIAPRTVDKYWRAARAWLHGALST